jgi:hypothetical protein
MDRMMKPGDTLQFHADNFCWLAIWTGIERTTPDGSKDFKILFFQGEHCPQEQWRWSTTWAFQGELSPWTGPWPEGALETLYKKCWDRETTLDVLAHTVAGATGGQVQKIYHELAEVQRATAKNS